MVPFRLLALTGFLGLALSQLSTAAEADFDAWAEEFTQAWVRADPMAATVTQYLPAEETAQLDALLIAKDAQYGTPLDRELREARARRARQGLDAIAAWTKKDLTPSQRASALYLASRLDDSLRNIEFAEYRFVFEQFRGLQISLINFLAVTHPLRTPADVESYLKRLNQVAGLLDSGITEAKARADRGILPPKFILERTLEGIDRFLKPSAAENDLVVALRTKSADIKELSSEQRAAALRRAEEIVANAVRPAFERIRVLLVSQLPASADDAGLWRLPGGDRAYAAALATNTTTHLTAEEIHQLGLQQVALIESEMDRLLRQLGLTEGTMQSRYDALEKSLQPPSNPDPREGLIAAHTAMLRDAEQRATLLFDLRPQAPVEVRREPAFTEKSAAAHYSAPAPDGSRPGIFWAPLPGPTFAVLRMRSLTYHEGVPGHHFQIALQQESKELPRFRSLRTYGVLSAFAEGWGLYAERIADEAGWYEGDPQGRLGYLSSMLFRARRLVVDTGLHAKRWTRQQAIDYGINASEIERYVTMPGQACSYMVGQLKLVELRERAKSRLGSKFSLKEYHNLILRTGELPLDVLEEVVDNWIRSQS